MSAGDKNFWLIKTDEFGNVSDASWIVLPLLVIATLAIFIAKKKVLRKRSKEKRISFFHEAGAGNCIQPMEISPQNSLFL